MVVVTVGITAGITDADIIAVTRGMRATDRIITREAIRARRIITDVMAADRARRTIVRVRCIKDLDPVRDDRDMFRIDRIPTGRDRAEKVMRAAAIITEAVAVMAIAWRTGVAAARDGIETARVAIERFLTDPIDDRYLRFARRAQSRFPSESIVERSGASRCKKTVFVAPNE